MDEPSPLATPTFLAEAELYRYDPDDDKCSEKPLKENDHAMDALRYLINAMDAHKLARGWRRWLPRNQDGDLLPGRGVVNFVPYLREIKALGIDGTISIELEYSPEPDKIVEWVREAYQAADRLLQEVKLRE